MERVRGITINTDASYYNEHKIGGYAFWIVCDLFKITNGGKFKREIYGPSEAETYCIGNAIARLLAQKELPEVEFLIINTDSKTSIRDIRQQRSEAGKTVNKLWRELLQRLKPKVHQFRHIKAHSGKNDARSYVNEWCDREAKRWARIAIKEKLTKN